MIATTRFRCRWGRRFNSGLTLNSQYTFGRSLGNTAGSNEASTVGNIARKTADFDYDNGYNNFDVRRLAQTCWPNCDPNCNLRVSRLTGVKR